MVEKILEPETIMDVVVPPPVQQVVNHDELPYWYPTPWSHGPEPEDDDFWSDDDIEVLELADDTTTLIEEEVVEGIEIEAASEVQPIRLSPASTAQPSEPMDEIEDDMMAVDIEHVSSWEDEFGDELMDLPTIVGGQFDPVGDIDELEALLFGEPTKGIEEELYQKEKEVEDNCLVEKVDDGSPTHLTREIAQRPWNVARVSTICRDDRFLHHMIRIRFGPGKYKYWWAEKETSCGAWEFRRADQFEVVDAIGDYLDHEMERAREIAKDDVRERPVLGVVDCCCRWGTGWKGITDQEFETPRPVSDREVEAICFDPP